MRGYTVEYKSNNNVVYSCKYHVIWCPKYRRPVLVPEVAERLRDIICAVSEECGAEVIELEVMPDHVHLLVEADPQFGIHQLVRRIKGRSSRLLRDEFRWLRSRLPTLWTNSYFVATVGGRRLLSSSSTLNNRSGSERTPSFVCELPLRAAPAETQVLNARLEAARQVYNACLGEALRRARLMRERRAYRKARHLPKGEERTACFRSVRRSVEFTGAALQRYAVRLRQRAFREHLDVHVAQKLASRAFAAVEQWVLGKRGRPRFKGHRQLDTVEGKSNHAGIRWRGDAVEWKGLILPARIDPEDPVIAHALGCRVKYGRLVRRKLGGRDRFFVQLVCEGTPYRKLQRVVGDGEVGLDIGPSTIAVVGEDSALLVPFCEEVARNHRLIRRLQRKLDRQRRANNPDNYLPDGRVKPGPKRWRKSNRQHRTGEALAELLRREAAHRKTLHGQMAHRVLAMGKRIKTEKLSYRAFQRQYGRSVSVRAPGLFLSILRRKAESAGGEVIEFPACTAKLSQTCHACGTLQKKSLSQRVHACACGVEMQRDLYSAFLARCVGEDHLLHADLAQKRWSGAEPLLRAAWSRATQPASGRLVPFSFGAAPRSRSGSLAQEGTAKAEGRDVVAAAQASGESSEEAAVVSPQNSPALAVGRFRSGRTLRLAAGGELWRAGPSQATAAADGWAIEWSRGR